MPELRPHIFSPVREKLAVAGIGRITEKARFGSVISSAFAYTRDPLKQFCFERLNVDELDRALLESANQHLIPLFPPSPATGTHATAAHKTPRVHGHRSKQSSAPCDGPPACDVALSVSRIQRLAEKPSS